MTGMAILKPVVGLAIWTMVMWFWLYRTRIPALKAAQVAPDELVRDPAKSLDAVLPREVQWVAHNYNHLHEAPTVFYAMALTLALTGHGDGVAATLGWIYLVLRVVHSLVQVLGNRVMVRFAIFALSSVVLMVLIGLAAAAVFNP